jgi:hypothetical protein
MLSLRVAIKNACTTFQFFENTARANYPYIMSMTLPTVIRIGSRFHPVTCTPHMQSSRLHMRSHRGRRWHRPEVAGCSAYCCSFSNRVHWEELITLVLCDVLHWLPVKQRMKYEIAMMTSGCVGDTCLAYFTIMCAYNSRSCALLVTVTSSFRQTKERRNLAVEIFSLPPPLPETIFS